MKTKSYSEFRKNLAATLDSVADEHDPVLITRDRGKPAAILMSVEDFTSYEETAYLLQSPKMLNVSVQRSVIWRLEMGKSKVSSSETHFS